jgi:hypothetical protein
MTSKHLSDYDIQQLALDEANCDHSIIQHGRTCASCNSRIKVYRLIFDSLERQPKAVFTFDLSEVLLPKLVAKQEMPRVAAGLAYLAATITATLIAAVSYLFGENLLDIFSRISTMSLYVIGAASSTFLAFQIIDMFKKHKKQMSNLELSGTTATLIGHSGNLNDSTSN